MNETREDVRQQAVIEPLRKTMEMPLQIVGGAAQSSEASADGAGNHETPMENRGMAARQDFRGPAYEDKRSCNNFSVQV